MKAYLDHIGIAVSDLPASLAFFRDGLGLELHGEEEVTSQKVRAHFLHAGGSSIELLEATAPDSPIAKYIATEACHRIVDAALQVHGGAGYLRESEIERLYRDARVLRIYEGTSQIQLMTIAKELQRR